MMRCGLVTLLMLVIAALPRGLALAAPGWSTVAGGANLVRPVFWEDMLDATADRGVVTISGSPQTESTPSIDRYGPRLHLMGDFGLTMSLQATSTDLAVLSLVDDVPEAEWGSAMRRLEIGLEQGQVVLGVFDGSTAEASQWQTFAVDAGVGPITLGLHREGDSYSLEVSGLEVTRFRDPGVYQTAHLLLGARVAAGNLLTVASLDVQAPLDQPATVQIDRCTPTRLLAAGTDASGQQTGMWWIWPDDGFVRQADPGTSGRTYLVAVSPDRRWVVYYQAPANYNPATDRFIVDTWVMDLENDDRYKLVVGNSPIGWISDGAAVVLGERPDVMALVPSGELVPAQGSLVYGLSMRSAVAPDQHLRAIVDTTPQGANGISIEDAASGDEVMHIPTGRGAPQLAWAPDSSRLAFTSGNDSPEGLIWKLRVASIADQRVSLLSSTADMLLHSVLWPPPLPGCA